MRRITLPRLRPLPSHLGIHWKMPTLNVRLLKATEPPGIQDPSQSNSYGLGFILILSLPPVRPSGQFSHLPYGPLVRPDLAGIGFHVPAVFGTPLPGIPVFGVDELLNLFHFLKQPQKTITVKHLQVPFRPLRCRGQGLCRGGVRHATPRPGLGVKSTTTFLALTVALLRLSI